MLTILKDGEYKELMFEMEALRAQTANYRSQHNDLLISNHEKNKTIVDMKKVIDEIQDSQVKNKPCGCSEPHAYEGFTLQDGIAIIILLLTIYVLYKRYCNEN